MAESGGIPPIPGYAYLMTDPSRQWVKVGIAARLGRARQHSRHGWTELERTFGQDGFLADPRGEVEVPVLGTFERSKGACAKCGANKPSIGRNGADGLTEVAHLRCFPGVADAFRVRWRRAGRATLDRVGALDFDPTELRPGGFTPLREPWPQLPTRDPGDYGRNALNISCIWGIPSATVINALDVAWENGEVELRRAMGRQFGVRVRRRGGLPTCLLSDGTRKVQERLAFAPKLNRC
jgi:hypothetical protein